jgi:hypothetical protein
MTSGRITLGLATLAVLAAALLPAAPAAGAKKRGGTINIARSVNAVIPDRGPGATAPWGQLVTTIEVGKKFRGMRIRDVDVTVQTTGAGLNAARGVFPRLSAPNGATSNLFQNLNGYIQPNNSIGPLTLDDEAPLGIAFGAPVNPLDLYQPWAGSARPFGSLFPMDGGPVTGTWTLRVFDALNSDFSVLNSWTLRVTAGRPFATK